MPLNKNSQKVVIIRSDYHDRRWNLIMQEPSCRPSRRGIASPLNSNYHYDRRGYCRRSLYGAHNWRVVKILEKEQLMGLLPTPAVR